MAPEAILFSLAALGIIFGLGVWWAWHEGELSGETALVYIIVWGVSLFALWRLGGLIYFLGVNLILDGILILKIFKHDPEVPPIHRDW